ncbi:5-formyltetrahydrofolate cyclo-ligase [Paenibacillus cisolokensis]|uniref:5-formyltetrahydrofolate cyclo-ligase n=1 Tax=Paenibacillus cisolokensis TaxID=1658519 RepID=UPI003D2E3010
MLPFESENQIGPPAQLQRQLKQQLRQRMSKRRDSLAEEVRRELSVLACRHAAQLMEQRGLQRMLVYVPFRSELDSRPLIEWAWEAGVEVLVPRSVPRDRSMELYLLRSWDQLVPGAYGILEPDPAVAERHEDAAPDIVWVPGLAFDRKGGRLGYGGGYYDRLHDKLNRLRQDPERNAPGTSKSTMWMGLAYEIQVVDQVPMDRHDAVLDGLVTNEGCTERNGQKHTEGEGWN